MEHPKLRLIDIFPIEISGQQTVYLRDPYNTKNSFIPRKIFDDIVRYFDGNHSVSDIQSILTQRHGESDIQQTIHQVIEELDKNLLLDNNRSRDFIKKLKDDFRNSTIRKDAHAGTAYEADRDKLKDQIDGVFTSADGPGKPSSSNKTAGLKGVIAPHIDIRMWRAVFRLGLQRDCRVV